LANAAHAADTPEKRQARAQAFWEEGAAKYDVGRFDDAIKLFEEAYDIWPFPEILFNLCQAHRQKKNYERAVFYCRSYLRNKPDAANAGDVNDLVTEMDKIVEAQKANEASPPEGVQHPEMRALHPEHAAKPMRSDIRRVPWYRHTWGWIAATTGAVVVGAGIGFLWSASNLESDARTTMNESDANRLLGESADRSTIGATLTIAGVSLLATSVILFALPAHERAPIILSVGPESISIAGSF
jgi:tetratricopeptide (TPR) repeat protein